MPLPQSTRVRARRIRSIWAWLIGSAALVAVLAGCTQGFYETRSIAPPAVAGQSCLERCELLKNQCRGRQETRERACGDWYATAKEDYDRCRAGTATDPGRRCRTPTGCLGADLSICDQEYQTCFMDCGGRVEKRLNPWPAFRKPAAAGAAAGTRLGQP